MNLLKNRTVIGVICIVLSLIICFAVTPLFNQSISEKTEIVRVVKPVKNGEEIQSDMVKQVEVGGYNLPEDVVKSSDTVIGKFATADLAVGDYILSSKGTDGRERLSLSPDRRKAGHFRICKELCKRTVRKAAER